MNLRARCALVVTLGACLPTAWPAAQHIRLTPSKLPIEFFLSVPDGRGIVYRVTEGQTNTLMRTRLSFSPVPVDLEDVSDEFSPGEFVVSPDGRRLVYLTAYDPFDYFVVELYSQPLDGSAPPVKLNGTLNGANDDVEWFEVCGERVLYRANQVTGLGVYSVPIDGSTSAVPMPANMSSVRLITPDGDRVIYGSDGERWTVPSDASAPAVQIQGSNIGGIMKVSSDSTRLYYTARQGTGPRELYRAPVDASAPPVRINAPLTIGGNVEEVFALTPDETRAVYVADQDVNNLLELYIAPVDGSGASIQLSAPVGPGVPRFDGSSFLVSDSRAVYKGELGTTLDKMMSVPLDGSAAPVEIASFPRGDSTLRRLGRSHLVYLLDDDVTLADDLYSVPLDGSAPPVKLDLSVPSAGCGVDAYVLDPRGEHALYRADQELNGFFDLHWVPLDGSRPARKVNPPGVQVDSTFAGTFALTRDGMRALYVGDAGDGVTGAFLDAVTTRPGVARR